MTVTTGPKGYFSEVWMDPLLKRVLSCAVFLHLPRRSGKLQPVMTELRRYLNGGRYPRKDGAEEGRENRPAGQAEMCYGRAKRNFPPPRGACSTA